MRGKIKFFRYSSIFFSPGISPFPFSASKHILFGVYCLGERDETDRKADIALKLLFIKAYAPAGRCEPWEERRGQKREDPGQGRGTRRAAGWAPGD